MPEIRKIVLSSGKVRYRAVVDIGRDPETGRRLQKTITLDRRKDVVDEIARITHQRRTGDYVQVVHAHRRRGTRPAAAGTDGRRRVSNRPELQRRPAPGPRPAGQQAAAVDRRAGHR
jgi:hypothetical protein